MINDENFLKLTICTSELGAWVKLEKENDENEKWMECILWV